MSHPQLQPSASAVSQSNTAENRAQLEPVPNTSVTDSTESTFEAPKMTVTTSSMANKEPKTPSLPRSAIFSSPAPQISLPETPERGPRHIRNVDETPLLSPPMVSSNHFLQTPQRKKGGSNSGAGPDFYSLFKSPEVKMEDKKLKRRSVELYNITDAKSPEQFHKEYDTEHLLKSPRRDYKEIRKLSENLRTRLNYANVKVKHGWSKKSIGELEHSLEEIATNPQRSSAFNSKPTAHPDSKQLDDFWSLRTDNLPTVTPSEKNTDAPSLNGNSSFLSGLGSNTMSPIRQTNVPVLMDSPGFGVVHHHRRKSSFASSINLDDVAGRGIKTSPDLIAASTSMVPNASTNSQLSLPPMGLQSSPLKKYDHLRRSGSQSKKHLSLSTGNAQTSDKLEQDAIISLISLSSPGKYNASISPSPPTHAVSPIKATPSNILSNGLPSLDGISNKRLPPLPHSGNVPLSAPGLLGSSWGALGDHPFTSMGGVTNYESYANHHRHTSSNCSSNSGNERYFLPTPPKFDTTSGGLLVSNVAKSNGSIHPMSTLPETALGVSTGVPGGVFGRPGGMRVAGGNGSHVGGGGGDGDETTEEEVTDDEETFIADTSTKSAAGTSV